MFAAWNQAELGILDGIQAWMQNPVFDFLMPVLSFFANGGWGWIALGLVLMLRKRTRKTGFLMLIGMLLGLLIGNLLLKLTVARERPCWINDSYILLIKNPTDYSFPSGHTLASVISATVLTIRERRFGWCAIPVAAVIAFSRLYLYVHFPTDVLAGALLGVVIGVSVCLAADRFTKVSERKKTNATHSETDL